MHNVWVGFDRTSRALDASTQRPSGTTPTEVHGFCPRPNAPMRLTDMAGMCTPTEKQQRLSRWNNTVRQVCMHACWSPQPELSSSCAAGRNNTPASRQKSTNKR